MDIITRGAVIRALEKIRKDGVKVNAICLAVDRATDKQPGYWYGFLYQNILREKEPFGQVNNTEPRARFLNVASSLYPQFGRYLKEPSQSNNSAIEAYKVIQEGLRIVQSGLAQISKEIVV